VSIPVSFRRPNLNLVFLGSEQLLNEVSCLLIPPGMPARCAISNVDCGGLCDLASRERPSLYSKEDFNRRCAESLTPSMARTRFDRSIKEKASRDRRLLLVDGHGSHVNLTFIVHLQVSRPLPGVSGVPEVRPRISSHIESF
jgi:hypothetical protein